MAIDKRSETWMSVSAALDRIEQLEMPILFSEKQDHDRTQYARGKLKVIHELRELAEADTERLTHPI